MIKTQQFRTQRRGGRGSGASRRARCGYLYVAVLFTSLIVGAAVATAISLDTIRVKSKHAQVDRGAAIRLAESEIHRAVATLSADANWRTNYANASWSTWTDYGASLGEPNAMARFQLLDPDGDLGDDALDDVQVVAHARYGTAQAAVAVDIESGFAPIEALRHGVVSSGNLQVDLGGAVVTERPIFVGRHCLAVHSGSITAPKLKCSGSIEPTLRGDLVPDASPVEMPSSTALDQYVDAGTEIDLSSLPLRSGVPTIVGSLLSGTDNPYGSPDPNAIYWIDAAGGAVQIRNSRISATLAIRNASDVYVRDGILWESAHASLITDGSVYLYSLTGLDESALGVNFNPPSTPYHGFSDATSTGRYPLLFKGVLYSEGHVVVLRGNGPIMEVTGTIIGLTVAILDDLRVRSYDELLTDVPLGFVEPGELRFKVGTFRRVPIP